MKKRKKIIVISLGGSLIVPDKIDIKFMENFKKIIKRNSNNYKFIIVCGGGSIARKYIFGLKNKNDKTQSKAGIAATRMNAKFVSLFLDIDSEQELPLSVRDIKKFLRKQNIVVCGALKFKPRQTTDSNAAEIAAYFKTSFVNLTNVSGLYDKNPKKYSNAKFIPEISWKKFDRMASKMKFEPGQHFVLDQTASKIIQNRKIPTSIIGKNMNELDKFLKNKRFKGTTIQG